MTAPTEPLKQPISAAAGSYYRNMRYLMFVVILAMGCWFLYDGFVKYPKKNALYDQLAAQKEALQKANPDDPKVAELSSQLKDHGKRYQDSDIALQKGLGFALPPIGVGLLAYWLHKSRGRVELRDDTIFAPGHPPVPLSAVKEVDSTLWNRKGIAKVHYQLPGGGSGTLTLDDFIYDRKPIDAIYDAALASAASRPATQSPA
jgi:hypothetical protein